MVRPLTKEVCLTRFHEAHGDRYDYKNVVYKNNNSKVEIICTKHGPFFQSPSGHMDGKGCEECAKESRPKVKRENAAKKFVGEALLVIEHQGRGYTYEKAVYVGSRVKLSVTCPEHGDFDVTPNNHLKGRGCPDCSEYGYRRSKPGNLYILQCQDTTKIGITNNPVKDRKNSISNSYGNEFTVLREHRFENGIIPCKVETSLLKFLKEKYFQPTEKFQGSTECFYEVDLQELLEVTEQLIQEHTEAQQQQ